MRERFTAGRLLLLTLGAILLVILLIVLVSLGTDSGSGS